MPRKGAGSKYNRGALADAPSQSTTQPVVAPTGMPYGAAGALQSAQQAIPLPATPPPAPTGAPPPAGAAPPGPGGMEAALSAAQQMPSPAGSLTAPSQRPHEPVTAGQWSGVGPGPEARAPMPGPAGPAQTVQGLLASMAQQPGAGSDLAYLAGFVANGKV